MGSLYNFKYKPQDNKKKSPGIILSSKIFTRVSSASIQGSNDFGQ